MIHINILTLSHKIRDSATKGKWITRLMGSNNTPYFDSGIRNR